MGVQSDRLMPKIVISADLKCLYDLMLYQGEVVPVLNWLEVKSLSLVSKKSILVTGRGGL
jgi:hypothetical protein